MPLTADARAEYVDDAQTYLDLMRRTQQWDGLAPDAVKHWLDNFPAGALRYFACRILRGLLYYSERDIETLLREVLFHQVVGRMVRQREQLPSGFGRYPATLAYQFSLYLERTLLVPLTATGNPAESSPEIARIAEQRLNIQRTNICYPDRLAEQDFSKFKHVVIVDDNLGSGDQFRTFWTEYKLPDNSPISAVLAFNGVTVHSLVLVGTAAALTDLRRDFSEVTFCCAQELPATYGVFAPDSIYWPDSEEQAEARDSIDAHLRVHGIPLLGYQDMTYALILHKTVPDWCLPALWRKTEDWSALLARRYAA